METAKAFIAEARHNLMQEFLPRIERCAEQLNDTEIWWRPNEESNSIGNLMLHLAGNLRQWIISGVGGADDDRIRQQEFDERSVIPKSELLAKLRTTVEEADATLANFDAAKILEERQIQKLEVSLLSAIFHVVEHFSMHTGQIILLTKMIKEKDLGFYNFSKGIPESDWLKR